MSSSLLLESSGALLLETLGGHVLLESSTGTTGFHLVLETLGGNLLLESSGSLLLESSSSSGGSANSFLLLL